MKISRGGKAKIGQKYFLHGKASVCVKPGIKVTSQLDKGAQQWSGRVTTA